jgi:hypothetical protein
MDGTWVNWDRVLALPPIIILPFHQTFSFPIFHIEYASVISLFLLQSVFELRFFSTLNARFLFPLPLYVYSSSP